jgi:hypothetical protein
VTTQFVVGGPTAISSKLGYLLSGPLPPFARETPSHRHTVMHVATHTDSEDFVLEKFWDLESIGITDKPNPLDISYDTFIQTQLRRENERYIAKLPTNLAVCQKRTRAMTQRPTPDLRNVYD